ncbi:ATP-binding protein [Mariprofundus sp. KV]|uniref:ATP-binding response regulator n=1 Tax=Mariprofundus sp. KV TaxID=2608715 RepID=UPI0015A0C4AB|nr:ATP-binding protein [Mariprofundus sp. KV]NWF35723.1 PAS domain S-box protein [Mariprofundus sp. KV]
MRSLIIKQKFIFIGIGCGIAAWLLDSAIDSAFFSHEPFSEQLFSPSTFEIYIRSLLFVLFLLFGIYAQMATSRLDISNAFLNKLSSAIKQTDEAICITDRDGVIEFVNPAFTKLSGFTLAEALGKPANIQKSGSHDVAFYKEMASTIEGGQTWQKRIINKRRDGSLYPAMMSISPIFNGRGEITHFIGLQQNLESHEKLEQQFYQAQKMEAIGSLVGGIAHDFNNSLAAITGNIFLIKDEIEDRPEIVEQLEGIENIAFSAAEMIQQLLAFSRRGTITMQPIGLNGYLKEITKLHQSSTPEHINFTIAISSEPMTVAADIHLLHQVILNLINNARDAVSGVSAPEIHLTLEKTAVTDTLRKQHPDADALAYAVISIHDNGCGISSEIRDKIFEPFFTTKEIGKGTGLGLAMALGAVESHGGFITTNHDNGTTFSIYLPLTDSESGQKNVSNESRLIKGDGETILLVDDDLGLLTTGREILKKLNYNVITAADGAMAVELYSSYRERIELIIIDAVMPKLGGSDALFEIRKINPDVKALFISGYDNIERTAAGNSNSEEIQLSKPFEIGTFSRLIHERLQAS